MWRRFQRPENKPHLRALESLTETEPRWFLQLLDKGATKQHEFMIVQVWVTVDGDTPACDLIPASCGSPKPLVAGTSKSEALARALLSRQTCERAMTAEQPGYIPACPDEGDIERFAEEAWRNCRDLWCADKPNIGACREFARRVSSSFGPQGESFLLSDVKESQGFLGFNHQKIRRVVDA